MFIVFTIFQDLEEKMGEIQALVQEYISKDLKEKTEKYHVMVIISFSILFMYYILQHYLFFFLQELDEKINKIENNVQGNYQVMFVFLNVIVSNNIFCGIFVYFFQELAKKVDQNMKDIEVKKEKHRVRFVNSRNIIIPYHYF